MRGSDRGAVGSSCCPPTALSTTTTGYRSYPKHLLSIQAVSVAPSELAASRGPMPPLQSLSLQHSDASSPEPLAARSGRTSSTPLQTSAPTCRLGPRPLGPAIPSAVPSAEVTVHPTWRPPPLPLDVAGNNSAADFMVMLPARRERERVDTVTDKPTDMASPPAPSVPPSWSVTSRRLSHAEDASRVHNLNSLSVCELRAELLEEHAVTPQEVEACIERTDLEALLRAAAAHSQRILAAADAAAEAEADAAAKAGVAEAGKALEAAAAAEAEAEAAAEAEAEAEAEAAAEAAAVAAAAAVAEAEAAAVAEAEASAAAMAEAEAEAAAALSEKPLSRADLAREMVALFDQTAEVLLGGTTLAEDSEAGGEGGAVVAVAVEQKEKKDAEQQEEGEQQQIARLLREVKEAQEAQEAVAAEEGDGDAGGAESVGSPAAALPRVVRARRALALEQSVLPSWESGESLLLLPLQAQPTTFPTHLVHR